jgi:hypothetical protein
VGLLAEPAESLAPMFRPTKLLNERIYLNKLALHRIDQQIIRIVRSHLHPTIDVFSARPRPYASTLAHIS